MTVKTIEANGLKIKITAKHKIPKKIIDGVHLLVKKVPLEDEELYDWEDIKKELKAKHPEIDYPGRRLMSYSMSQVITQKDMTKRYGISQGSNRAIENSKKGIGVKQAQKLAKVLGIDYRKLL